MNHFATLLGFVLTVFVSVASANTSITTEAGEEIVLYTTSCMFDSAAGAKNAKSEVMGLKGVILYGCWYDQNDTVRVKWHRILGRNDNMTQFDAEVVIAKQATPSHWYVADPREQRCERLHDVFPAVGANPAAQTPQNAVEFAKRGGYTASLDYLSPSRINMTVEEEGSVVGSFSLFGDEDDCHEFLHFMHAGEFPVQKGDQQQTNEPVFGSYVGEADGLIIGVETQPRGTAFVIVNKTQSDLTVKPSGLKIVTEQTSITPCTFHMVSLMGIGSPLSSVTIRAGRQEGFMLGACTALTGGAPTNDVLLITQPVQKAVFDNREVSLKPDR